LPRTPVSDVNREYEPDFRCRVADFFYMPGKEAPA
jgi:hypothetical protein